MTRTVGATLAIGPGSVSEFNQETRLSKPKKKYPTIFVIRLFVPFMTTVLEHGLAVRPIGEASPFGAAELLELVVDDQLSKNEQT